MERPMTLDLNGAGRGSALGALEFARKTASVTKSVNPSCPNPLRARGIAPPPPPGSVEGILNAMNTQYGGRIQKPSPGALMIMRQHQRHATDGRQMIQERRPVHTIAQAAGNGVMQNCYVTIDASACRVIGQPPGAVRIRTTVLKKPTVTQTVVINSVYNGDSSQGNGVRVQSRLNTLQNSFSSNDQPPALMMPLENNRPWYGNKNGYQNGFSRMNNFNRLQKKEKVGGPITGNWKDVDVSKEDLDNDLDAYMANATGGLAKMKLGWCEKVDFPDAVKNNLDTTMEQD